MRSHRSPSVAAESAGHAGSAVEAVPHGGGPDAAAELPRDPAPERAAIAPDEAWRDRPIPVDRAFLEAALDFRQTLRTLAAAVVPRFADWCFVDLVDGDGVLRRAEVAHADPSKAPLAREMRSIVLGPGWATPGAQAIRDRTPRLFREVTGEIAAWATHDERHLAVLRAIAPCSLLAVPLVSRDRAIGALTLVRSTMQPPLDDGDVAFAEDLAVPAALALDNARWYQAEKAARAAAQEDADREHADRIEAQRSVLFLRRLESISASLSSLLSPAAIARVAVESGLSLLEPSTAIVVRASPGGESLDVLHAQGFPDDVALALRRLPADGPSLVAEAFRVQTAVWVPTEAALRQGYPGAAESVLRIGERAWASVPLRVDGRTVGALGVGFPRPRDLDGVERRFVLTVAQQIAQALERARLRDE